VLDVAAALGQTAALLALLSRCSSVKVINSALNYAKKHQRLECINILTAKINSIEDEGLSVVSLEKRNSLTFSVGELQPKGDEQTQSKKRKITAKTL